MRSSSFLSLALAFALAATAGAQDVATVSSFTRDGKTFTLTATERDATIGPGWPAALLRWVVRVDGRLVRPSREDGGRLIGHKYRHAERGFTVETFPDAERPLGWLLTGYSARGNTTSLRVGVVSIASVVSSCRGYREYSFDCKTAPVVRATADGGCDLWSSRQDWGKGGTASSIFVPLRVHVGADGAIGRAPLPTDSSEWPAIPHVGSFPGVFVAALHERNAALMSWALDHLYDPADEEWYSAYGLASRERLRESARLTRRIVEDETRLKELVEARD